MIVFFDDARHIICAPYDVAALHELAATIGLKRCWWHASRHPHYDVPKRWARDDFAELRRRLKAAGVAHAKVSQRFVLETINAEDVQVRVARNPEVG